jgi:hypothetical protein
MSEPRARISFDKLPGRDLRDNLGARVRNWGNISTGSFADEKRTGCRGSRNLLSELLEAIKGTSLQAELSAVRLLFELF